MSILHEIDKHIVRFESITGHYGQPQDTTIYLGRVQCEEFEAAATAAFVMIMMGEPERKCRKRVFQKHGHQYEYKGRRVYRVDTENHLAIGF